MTEAEAKLKACCAPHGGPQAEFVMVDGCPTPKDWSDPDHRDLMSVWFKPCMGSACMAWRWREDWVSSSHDPVAGTLTIRLKDGAREQGGCGLAGAPQ